MAFSRSLPSDLDKMHLQPPTIRHPVPSSHSPSPLPPSSHSQPSSPASSPCPTPPPSLPVAVAENKVTNQCLLPPDAFDPLMATLRAIGKDRLDCQQALQGLAGVLEELRELEKEEEVEREAKEREGAEEGRGRRRRRENLGDHNEKDSHDKEMEKEVRRREEEAIGFDADDEDEDGDEDEAEGAVEGRSSPAHDHHRNRRHRFDDPKRDDGLASDFDDDDDDDYLDDGDFDGGEAMDVDEEFGEVLHALDGSYERLYENMWAMDERLSRIEQDVRELGGAGSMLAVVDGQAR